MVSTTQSRCALVLLMLGGFAFPAPNDQVLLRRVKLKMTKNLSRVPNYTCLETISRGRRGPDRLVISVPGKEVPFRTLDVIRLEVAEVSGVELFARAGEHNFDKKDITEFASGGLIGNGLFSSFAHDVFVTSNPTYRFAGEEQVDGRVLVRYDFTTPQFMSGYKIGTNFGAAEVGYHGSFWTDPQTFDAVRLEIVADAIPTYTGLTNAENRIDFAIVRIGSRDVLLPQSGELKTRMLNGWESRNHISFTHCREYGVESVIKFDDVTDSTESAGGGTKFVEVPPGLLLTLRLETPVDSATAHVGDVISAIVEVEAKHRGAVIVPKDAVVSGRLRRMEVHTEGWPYVLAGLEFTGIEFEGKQTRFFAGLEKIILPPGAEGPKRVVARDLPGVGVVTATGSSLRLPKATEMIWKTISYAQAAEVGK